MAAALPKAAYGTLDGIARLLHPSFRGYGVPARRLSPHRNVFGLPYAALVRRFLFQSTIGLSACQNILFLVCFDRAADVPIWKRGAISHAFQRGAIFILL